ncbi:Crp/Fnr family transcriptional regulator [Sphingopyxis sp. SE2]|uniref:Crp/Fnr family transcriptional regulator n=1 Tax=Sphingopyxis sp. SE2 TaxID=1586240 RepID=UPI0028C15B53|nr:Crp/Fnr family transcriptional regulator [Sphingopyxis sp. SE2]MDT7527777.1 Crp/Fnr family transcriptional regulator [Sphingopyxis sp. SE2]
MKPELSSLSRLDIFTGVSAPGLSAASEAARAESFGKGATVFRQGDEARRAYALSVGSVRIVQTGSDGGQAIVRFIAPGEMFGSVPLFTKRPLPADAVVAETALVLSWSEADLALLIDAHPPIAINIIRIVGARLADAQDRVRELSTQRAEQRIAHTLLRLVTQAGQENRGDIAIDLPLRRKDVAEISGTTLHTASRTLSAWAKAGLLTSHDHRLVLHDLSAITNIAEGFES